MHLPSPALVIASLALFVALGGTGMAAKALVTSADIKDGTIQLRDLSPSARLALRGWEGPEGPQGPPGPAASTFALETRLSRVENRVSGMCLYGKLVREVSRSSFSDSLYVSYVYC